MRAAHVAFNRFSHVAVISFAVIAGAMSVSSASAAVRYVNAALATGLNDGSSWANAYQGAGGLATALTAAAAGDQLWVVTGTYKPTTTATRTIALVLKNGVEVYGGFNGSETLLTQRNFGANPTTLSGDLSGNDGAAGSFVNYADNSIHIINAASTNTTAVLDGFTVIGGNANVAGGNQDRGGGILMLAASNSTIRKCRFEYNSCTFGGGAGYINSSSPTFTDCVFLGNRGGSFGGAFDQATGVNTQFTRCQFINNSAARAGAVEAFGSSAPVFTNCAFRGNAATGASGGGALWVGSTSNVTLRLCTIVGNTATVNFAGIQNTGTSVTISNSIIYGNTGPGGSQAVAQQLNLGGGSFNVTYSNVQGGFAGAGNISAAPIFENQAGGDLRLASGSPGIDAGNNAAVVAGTTIDLAGLARFVDDPAVADTGAGVAPLVDLGAYERQIPLCVADIDGSGTVGVSDLLSVIGAWGACGAPCPPSCAADIAPQPSGDCNVGVADLLLVITSWGACPS
jgi:hypothetical protein